MLIVIYFCNKIQLIGLTGGIACGKSTAGKYLHQIFNLNIIDCDKLARKIVEIGKPAYQKIVNEFGKEILMANGEIDRIKLGKIIFGNLKQRKKLNKITNKYIFLEIMKEIWKHFFINNEQIVVLDAPLLFETKILRWICFPIIVIFLTNEKTLIKRLCERDKINEEEAMTKIKYFCLIN